MATSTNDKNNSAAASYPPPQNPPPSSGAFHPYAYPPPPFYQQPETILTYQQPPSAARSFLCVFVSVIAAIVTILFIGLTINYFILKPSFPEFRVNSATLTSFNFNNSDLTAKWDISLIVSNPNKKLEITYNAIGADIYYENEFELLASTQLAPFKQPKQSKTVMGVQFEILNEYIDNSVADGIADGRFHGFVQFGMILNVLIKLNGLFHPNEFLLKVTCEPLSFGMSNNINNVTWILLGGLDCSR